MLDKKDKNGIVIAFLGPDGAGKSSIIERLKVKVAGYSSVTYFHLKPTIIKYSTKKQIAILDPHRLPNRTAWMSLLKLIYFIFVYRIGFLVNVNPKKSNNGLVIFDRYFYDVIIDPKRYRVGLPSKLVVLLAKLIPEPDILFVIDAPTDLIQDRVSEVPAFETERQRQAYLKLVDIYPFFKTIDASGSVDESVSQVLTHMEGVLSGAK